MRTDLDAAIYGTLAVGAVLGAESARQETYVHTLEASVIAILLYWLAHSYAGSAAQRLREGESLTALGLARAMAQASPIFLGAALPLLAVLVAWVAGAALGTAVNVAIWTAAIALVLIELLAALRARRSPRGVAIQCTLGALLAVGVIALKLSLH